MLRSSKRKGKRYGSRGFTCVSNPGAVAALYEANHRLVDRVAYERKKRGLKPNQYVPLREEGHAGT